MNSKSILYALLFFSFFANAQGNTKQQVKFEGIVTDLTTGQKIAGAKVTVSDDMQKTVIATATTDANGHYEASAPPVSRYALSASKPTYFITDSVIAGSESQYHTNLGLLTKPGYEFDMTIFDKAYEPNPINTLRDCKVEIYNNTSHEQELTIERLEKSTFHFSFTEGNHYTMLVRKPGYFNRRIELYVNINGCILCVDGMGISEPDLVPLMTNKNQTCHMLGTVALDSIQIGKRFQLNNIYYDFNKWDIRPEAALTLNKLAGFLMDNPSIKVELGSHTDSRGGDAYNLDLSDKRANAAVNYLTAEKGIDIERITAKGYGETELVNRCDDGISCSEADHQLNRRTEIKITGLLNKDPLWDKSLKQIIEDPNLYKKIIAQEKEDKSLKTK